MAETRDTSSKEVLMFGEKTEQPRRAEIISVGKDGKRQVAQGGVSRTPFADKPKKPEPQAAPEPAPQPRTQAASPTTTRKASDIVKQKPMTKPANPGSSKDVSKAMVADTMGTLMSDMRAKATEKGGVLSLSDIDAMEVEMAARAQEMEAAFAARLEDFAKASDQKKYHALRNRPFNRLLVKKFSHLFDEPAGPKTVHRRVLPGFFAAVDMLLGPDVVQKNQRRCQKIVDQTKSETGSANFTWDAVYAAKESVIVSLDAQVVIAARFVDYDKRLRWFLNLVNSNLAPATETMTTDEKSWQLAEQGAQRMLDALTADLRKVMSSDKGRERMIKRHGGEVVGDAIVALKRFVTG